jgi:hypothetical protein
MKYNKLLTAFFKKTILAQIVFLTAVFILVYILKPSFNFSGNSTPNLATLFINFETEKRFFEGEVVQNMTILDVLNAAVPTGNIKFNYAISDSGNVIVMEIDGHTNGTDNKYFNFYLNSKKIATKDLNKEIVREGDKIEVRDEQRINLAPDNNVKTSL